VPALPSVANMIDTKLTYTIGEDLVAANRFYIKYTGTAPTPAVIDSYASEVGTAWGTDLKSLAGNGVELTAVEAIDLSSPTSAVGSNTEAITGTRSGGNLPASMCTLISFEISRRYRGGHPRIYLPFGTDTDLLDSQTWTSAFLSAVATGWQNFIEAVLAITWSGGGPVSHNNVSYYEGFTPHIGTTGRYRNVSTPRTDPLVDQVVSYTVRGGIASQRKRLLRKA
jgi:hypothetical protein